MNLNLDINFSDIQWSQFGTTEFWFAIDRSGIHNIDKLLFLAGAVLVVLGIITLAYRRFAANQFLANVAGRLSRIFWTIGILEIIWFGLRYQLVQMMGTHFVAFLLLLVGLVWLYWPIKYLTRNYKADMEEAQRAANREKYLTKNK